MLLRRLAAAALAIAAVALVAPAAGAADHRFALVVGHNGSDDPELSPLKYADDDALRYSELLRHVVGGQGDLIVLADPDEDTQRLTGSWHPATPTRANLLKALGELRQRMQRAREAGDRPILYFVYSGHGNYDAEGRGYVHLDGGRFTTRDLYDHMMVPSQGDPTILVIDACNAALLVNSRGPGERRPARPSRMNLEAWPNVGLVLSSSSVGETHEWGRYLAGVFSHEVRSGLLGPADLDDDGRVTFPELAAFVAAANQKVRNPTVRIKAYVRPPLTDPMLPLIARDAARFPAVLRLDGLAGKAHVVDSEMVRYADFHRASGQKGWLALTGDGPYVLVHGDSERLIPKNPLGTLQLSALERRARTVLSARGNHSAYFDRTLFHQPYGLSFASVYLQDAYLDGLTVQRVVERPWYENVGAWSTLGGGVVALGVGLGFHLSAVDAQSRAQSTPWADERAEHNDAMARHRTVAGAMYGVGAAAVLGSVLWFALDRPTSEETYHPPLQVTVGPAGVGLTGGL